MNSTQNPIPIVGNSSIDERNAAPEVSEPAQRGTPAAALVDAVFTEDVEQCRQLLDRYPEIANTSLRHSLRVGRYDSPWAITSTWGPIYQQIPPVVFACLIPRLKEGRREFRSFSLANLEILKLLIAHGAKLELREEADEWTSYILMEVCWDYDSLEVFELLVSIGADINMRRLDNWDRTLLQIAAARGSARAVGFLLDRGISMSCSRDDHSSDGAEIDGTPLHQAAANGRNEVASLLLGRGGMADLEQRDKSGCTPLSCAAMGRPLWPVHDEFASSLEQRKRREETIRILVESGADIRADGPIAANYTSDSVLGHVVRWGGVSIIQYLVEMGSDIHEQRGYGDNSLTSYRAGGSMVTPLHKAAHVWNAAGVQTLLTLGASPTTEDQYGRQPLHWAAMGSYVLDDHSSFERVSNSWIDGIAKPEVSGLSAMLALQDATMRHLLLHKAPVNQRDRLGRTALHYAAHMKLTGAVKLLLAHGADLSSSDAEGRTGLHELACLLINHRNTEPLDREIGNEELHTYLARSLPLTDINRRDRLGNTALHIATRAASDTTAALLLKLGADPALPDVEGSAPLHLAARLADWVPLGTYESGEWAKWADRATRIRGLLLAAGADPGQRDSEGRTALEIEEAVAEKLRIGRESYLQRSSARSAGIGGGRGLGQPRPTGTSSAPGMGRGRERPAGDR